MLASVYHRRRKRNFTYCAVVGFLESWLEACASSSCPGYGYHTWPPRSWQPTPEYLPRDWLDFYHTLLWLVEPFVDNSRFTGTCYQATNWLHVVHTWDSAKRGASYRYHGMSKAVYLYPLHKPFLERLHG